MWFTRLAISRPILIWMALAAIAVLGLQAYVRLPAELNPRTDIPTLTVTTLYPGAGPAEMETQVSKPLEDAVGTVSGVQDVYSSSQANVSIISMNFQVGTNLDVATADVRGRVDAVRAQLPVEARPPIVAKLDINALPIFYLGIQCPSLSLQQLRSLADNTLLPRLERVRGVATVQVVGGEQREIHVSADDQKLAEVGMTLEDLVNSLKAAGRDIPGGSITQGKQETDVRLTGAFTSLEALRQVALLGSPAMAQASPPPSSSASSLPVPPLTLADVATVAEGKAERTEIDRINGQEGIGLVFTKSSDANTVAVVEEVKRTLSDLAPMLPRDLHQVVLRDDSTTVRDALEDVNVSLLLGAVLAMGVILLFLHNLRGTVIVSLAIPSCIIATFLVLGIAGFTLNQMTLLALSLSVGILVDDSIVVLESITRHLRQGESPEEAALNGRAEIGFADLTTTLVDVVVFVPIAFMGGIVGGFFREFGLTIVAATLFSLVVSFSVTPMLASRWYRKGETLEVHRGLFGRLEWFYRRLEAGYRRILRWALRRRGRVVLFSVAGLVGVFVIAFFKLGTDFLPGVDLGQIAINVEMPPGSSLNATDMVAHRAETLMAGVPEIEAVVTNVGQILGGFGSIPQQGAEFAQINLRLKDKGGWLESLLHPGSMANATRKRSDTDIADDLRKRLLSLTAETGGKITVAAIRSVQGAEAPVQIELRGNDLAALTGFATQVQERIRAMRGMRDPDISIRTGRPELQAQVDPQRAAQFHIPSSLTGAILRDSLAGNTDTSFSDKGESIPIRVRLEAMERDNPAQVGNIVVGSDSEGQPVRLSDIATLSRHVGPIAIDRHNGQRLITLSANLDPDVPLSEAQTRIDAILHSLPHDGIVVNWAGDAQTVAQSGVYFANALVLGIILVYILMASLFNSLGTPFIIMFTLPMALIGAIGALVLTGETMSLVSAIGIIMLVGLMGRNAILLLDYTNTLRSRGMLRNEAIEEAGAIRLRPILMTTTATIVGMLPVALRIGRASEVRAPMAVVVIGGLMVSTLLTLLVIPVLYSLFDDLVQRRGRTAKTTPVKQEPVL